MKWTRSYYGVSHLKNTKKGWRVTVSDYGLFCNAVISVIGYWFAPYQKDKNEWRQMNSVEDAKSWCEKRAIELGVIENV